MVSSALRKFLRTENGGMTAFGLLIFGTSLLMGSYAIDVSNLEAQTTQLQVTADAAAHDALVTRELLPEGDAIAAAVVRSEKMMPTKQYGTTLEAKNVVFGTWDKTKKIFTPVPAVPSA